MSEVDKLEICCIISVGTVLLFVGFHLYLWLKHRNRKGKP